VHIFVLCSAKVNIYFLKTIKNHKKIKKLPLNI